jgi:hypothetical protein
MVVIMLSILQLGRIEWMRRTLEVTVPAGVVMI